MINSIIIKNWDTSIMPDEIDKNGAELWYKNGGYHRKDDLTVMSQIIDRLPTSKFWSFLLS